MFKLRPATKKSIPIPVTLGAPGQCRYYQNLCGPSAVYGSEDIYGGHLAENMKSVPRFIAFNTKRGNLYRLG